MPDTNDLAKLKSLRTADDVAELFGLTYGALAKIFYRTSDGYRYRTFTLRKKSGGVRQISAPNRKIKLIQSKLAILLQEGYDAPPAVHGFLADKSIVTNAEQHLHKRFVFNADLKDFFGTITFGRVRKLLQAKPFEIPLLPATVLAHICCFEKKVPPGAPTSPIVSNLICRTLDRELQRLAKRNRSTYTRYADDLTFSFTCGKSKLPSSIVILSEDAPKPGPDLLDIIHKSGFSLNDAKTRLHNLHQRLEVTGLTVNEFVNVRRQFIRRTASMLYAWEEFGLKLAATDYLTKYSQTHAQRASGTPADFKQVVKGRLAFVHMVRGRSDPVYLKLAKRYNALIGDPKGSLPVTDPSDMEKNLFDALYVIEILYDGPDDTITSQGTGFFLDQIGFVTAAHVISDSKGNIYKNIQIRRWDKPNENLALEIKALDTHRDLAFGTLKEADGSVHQPISPFLRAPFPANTKDRVTLMGFPAYKVGQTPYVAETHVASRYVTHAVSKMEITAQIRNGNSGGPVLGKTGRVVGIAVEGADKAGGNNAVVLVKELLSMVAQSTQ